MSGYSINRTEVLQSKFKICSKCGELTLGFIDL